MSSIENTLTSFSEKASRKHHSLRIDMTPMVDLGFLLITFFVFTARLSEPKVMNLFMPDEKGAATPTKCSSSFTILVGAPDRIRWYACANGNPANFQTGSLSGEDGLRAALQEKQQLVAASTGNPTDLVVIIKPVKDCDYKTLIDVLDEMTINGITRYAITDAQEGDEVNE